MGWCQSDLHVVGGQRVFPLLIRWFQVRGRETRRLRTERVWKVMLCVGASNHELTFCLKIVYTLRICALPS